MLSRPGCGWGAVAEQVECEADEATSEDDVKYSHTSFAISQVFHLP